MHRALVVALVVSTLACTSPVEPAALEPVMARPRVTTPAPSDEVYTRLVVRLTRAGAAEVISATQVSGRLRQRHPRIGDYLAEVRAGGEVLALDSYSDPFVERSLGDESTLPDLESVVDEAEVTIRVPRVGLSRHDYSVTFFSVSGDVSDLWLDDGSVSLLRANGSIKRFALLDSAAIASATGAGQRLQHAAPAVIGE